MRSTLFSVLVAALAAAFVSSAHAESSGYREVQIFCLTRNIYEEARSESVQAQVMIGLITRARVMDEKWPNHFCRVIYQYRQFSWTLDKVHEKPKDKEAWMRAYLIATAVFDGKLALPIGWECARFYKRTDGKGVSERSRRFFRTRLFPIGEFGSHTAYGDKSCAQMASAR